MKVRFYGGPNDPSFGRPGDVFDPPPPTWYVPRPVTRSIGQLDDAALSPPEPIVYHRRKLVHPPGGEFIYVTGELEKVDAMILPRPPA